MYSIIRASVRIFAAGPLTLRYRAERSLAYLAGWKSPSGKD